MSPISLKFMIEKREGHGEDSNPLSIVKNDFYAVGVFDGMGGSGAALCKSEYGDNLTKAYVASRIIQEAVNAYIDNAKSPSEITSDGIRFTARGRLEQEKSHFPTKASGLRSKLVRDYPTTLAITTANKNEDDTHTVNSYWAGDSRNYLWTLDGFYQISKDDLDTELDPLDNLRNDGALSNCICADRDFFINNKSINVAGKFIILSATDGCFNYFATPMHFHEVLLTGLKLSEDVSDWENFCKEEMSAVTGDDVSLSLLAIGFNDFNELKSSFAQSEVKCINEINNAQNNIKALSKDLEEAKTFLENLIQAEWKEYKTSYLKYLNPEDTTNVESEVSVQQEKESSQIIVEEAPGKLADEEETLGESVSDESSTPDTTDVNNDSSKGEDKPHASENLNEKNVDDSKDNTECQTLDSESTKIDGEVSDKEKGSSPIIVKDDKKDAIESIDILEKDKVSDVSNKEIKETPKFGRIELEPSKPTSPRTSGFSKPSNRDVIKLVEAFSDNPSIQTANALFDIILDFGESIMTSIPPSIRKELKKFK